MCYFSYRNVIYRRSKKISVSSFFTGVSDRLLPASCIEFDDRNLRDSREGGRRLKSGVVTRKLHEHVGIH